ncbi:MAG: PQQ-binding-like beta-propeller repeat protein, partial [Bacteroidota bacterium]
MKQNEITALFFLLTLGSVGTGFSQAKSPDCWPSFRGDPQLTGTSPVSIQPPLKLLWTFKAGDAIKSSPVICESLICFGSDDGFIYALSPDGKLKWKYNAGTSVEAAPLYLDHTLYVGSLEGILFALNAETGSLKWKYPTEGQISGSSNWTWSANRKRKEILTGSYDYNLHAVDAITGKPLWKYES